VLQGLLSPQLEGVNMVSAPMLAKQRNIGVSEAKRERASRHENLIRLVVTTEAQTRSVSGTLTDGEPRVVEIKGIRMDAMLGRHMLFVTNRDKPGFIGRVGTTLGDAGINIATFNLGRTAPGADAIVLIEVDQAVPEPVLETIRQLPHVVQVKPLAF